eukprot:scaffold14371_cov18-Tisochrysis_lutea.AAC.2
MALVGALAQGDPVLLLWVLAVISVITRGDPLFLLREMALMGVLTCGDPGRFRVAALLVLHIIVCCLHRNGVNPNPFRAHLYFLAPVSSYMAGCVFVPQVSGQLSKEPHIWALRLFADCGSVSQRVLHLTLCLFAGSGSAGLWCARASAWASHPPFSGPPCWSGMHGSATTTGASTSRRASPSCIGTSMSAGASSSGTSTLPRMLLAFMALQFFLFVPPSRTHAVGDFGISTSSPCVFLLECMRLAFMAFQHILCVPPTKTHTLGVHGTPTSSLVVPLPEHMRLASLVYQRPLHVCPLLQRMRLAFMASAAYQIEIVLRQCVNGLKANWQEARLYRRMRKAVLREWSRLAQVGDMHKLRW